MTALLFAMAAAPTFADQLFARIDADYWNAKSGLYREAWSSDKPETQVAFNWSVGVMLSALNARARHDEAARKRLEQYVRGIKAYWNPRPPVPGYDASAFPGAMDRYYDDNAWMALALLEAAAVLDDPKLVDQARKALDYALSGEDEKLGGGIYWRESDRASKNTCSNAPTAFACFRYAEVAGDKSYREKGRRLLNWTLQNLQDPHDGLLWDNVRLNGRVDQTKYSYNTALTVRALAADGRRSEARRLFKTAWARWRGGGPGMDDVGRFAHLLADTGMALGFVKKEDARQIAAELEAFDVELRFGVAWNRPPESSQKRFELIDQASVLRFLELAR